MSITQANTNPNLLGLSGTNVSLKNGSEEPDEGFQLLLTTELEDAAVFDDSLLIKNSDGNEHSFAELADEVAQNLPFSEFNKDTGQLEQEIDAQLNKDKASALFYAKEKPELNLDQHLSIEIDGELEYGNSGDHFKGGEAALLSKDSEEAVTALQAQLQKSQTVESEQRNDLLQTGNSEDGYMTIAQLQLNKQQALFTGDLQNEKAISSQVAVAAEDGLESSADDGASLQQMELKSQKNIVGEKHSQSKAELFNQLFDKQQGVSAEIAKFSAQEADLTNFQKMSDIKNPNQSKLKLMQAIDNSTQTNLFRTVISDNILEMPTEMSAGTYKLVNNKLAMQQFSKNISHQLYMMVNGDVKNASLKLNPAELGPLDISLQLHKEKANVVFSSNHVLTKEAIEQAVPRLKEMLLEQGIELADIRVDINLQQSHQEQTAHDHSNNQRAQAAQSLHNNTEYTSQDNENKITSKQVNLSLVDAYV